MDVELNSIKEKTVSGFFWSALEKVGAQGVSLIVGIILARILCPDDYSVVSIVTIFFAFCNVFITSGLSTALLQKKEIDEIDVASVFYANLIIAFFLYTIIFICAPFISNLYEKPILIPVMRVMGITFFINMIKSVATTLIARKMQFKKFFLATLIGTVISAIIGISMAKLGFGCWSLIAQQMTNITIDTVILVCVSKLKLVKKFSIKRLKPLVTYSWKLLLGSFTWALFGQIKPLIVGIKFSPVDLAYYNKGETYPRLITTSFEGTLSDVFVPSIRTFQDDLEKVKNFFSRYNGISSYIVFPAMLGLFAVSDNFVNVILTEKWMDAVPFLRVFCIYYILESLSIGVIQTLKGIGRTDVVLKIDIFKQVIQVIVIVAFLVFSSTPLIFSFSTVCCMVISFIVGIIVMHKLIDYKFKLFFRDFLPNLIISVIMMILVLLVGRIIENSVIALIVQCVVGIISYLALSIVFKNPNFKYAIDIVKQRVNKNKEPNNV